MLCPTGSFVRLICWLSQKCKEKEEEEENGRIEDDIYYNLSTIDMWRYRTRLIIIAVIL